MNQRIKGIIVPTVTPLDAREEIDIAGSSNLVDYLVDNGVQSLFLLGTTGEYTRLTQRQKQIYVEVCSERNAGRVPLGVNISDQGSRKVLENLRMAEKIAADFVALSIPDYFAINGPEEQYAFFRQIAEATHLPLMLYNIPCCTGSTISVECIEKLLACKNVIGIKDSSGDLAYMNRIAEISRGCDFGIYNGHEKFFYETLDMGAQGIISSTANILPAEVSALYAGWAVGDDLVRERHYHLLQKIDACKHRMNDNTYGIYLLKYLLARKNICAAHMAEPFRKSVEKERNALELHDVFFQEARSVPHMPGHTTSRYVART